MQKRGVDAWINCNNTLLKLAVMVRAMTFLKQARGSKTNDIKLIFGRRGVIETKAKQNVSDRLGREVLQQCKICEK